MIRMPMCEQCKRLTITQRIESQSRLYDILSQIRKFIENDLIQFKKGNCDLEAIMPDKAWPADIIILEFKCTNCQNEFVLSCDTYHGSGGDWKKK